MITAYILGSLTTLVSVVVGYILGKPYLDKRLNKPVVKPLTTPTKTGATQP